MCRQFHFVPFLMAAMMMMMIGGQSRAEVARIYVGTYTTGESQGIYLLELDYDTGRVHPRGLAAETRNPSFLALHPSARYLYAVNEIGDYQGASSGSVTAFRIDQGTGKLQELNQVASSGADPCHLVVDATGRFVLLANYNGGNVAVLAVAQDGSLGKRTAFIQHQGKSVDPRRQQEPHAHSINLDAANRFAFAADLGLDQIVIYRFDVQQGSLANSGVARVAPGSGPRHFALHPSQRFAYAINEISSTITAFAYDKESGQLADIQVVSTLPVEYGDPSFTAEVQVSPDGRFVYGSNRGHDSIAVFAVDSETGKLTPVQIQKTLGKTPRNFGIDPTGHFLLAANQGSNTVTVFRIDAASGCLEPTGQVLTVPAPVCVKFQTLPDRP